MVKALKFQTYFLFLYSNNMFVFRAEITKMLVRIANWEDPDQPATSEAIRSGSALFVPTFSAGNYSV